MATMRRGPRLICSIWVFSERPPQTSTASVLSVGQILWNVLEHLHGELAGGEKDEREDGGLLAARGGNRDLLEALDHGNRGS